jgi:uncharacterized membrane protein YphA (DoxX/SURF4 family)
LRPGNKHLDYAALLITLALAALFIYTGFEKLEDPLVFADSVAAFAILPAILINLIALSIPPFEIACGLFLLWSPTRRIGALAVAIMSVLFFAALSSALLRGLTLDCGCFGIGAPSRTKMWFELGLDVILGAAGLLIYKLSLVGSLRGGDNLSAARNRGGIFR